MLSRETMEKLAKWAGGMGIIFIIQGVIQLFFFFITLPTGFAFIIGSTFTIYLGIKLRKARKFLRTASNYTEEFPANELNLVFENLSSFFKVQVVAVIIGIALGIIGIFSFISIFPEI